MHVKKGDEDEEDQGVTIVLQQSVVSTFSLKYLLNFTKSAPLAKKVTLSMSDEIPMLVSTASRARMPWAALLTCRSGFVSCRWDSTSSLGSSTTTSRTFFRTFLLPLPCSADIDHTLCFCSPKIGEE